MFLSIGCARLQDPKHPLSKAKRNPPTPTAGNQAPLRRSIHPTKEPKKVEEKPVEEEEHVDEGPVYKPPVVAEPPAPTPQLPPAATPGFPYGTLPLGAGRPVSPSGHYVGHHTPHVPPATPFV